MLVNERIELDHIMSCLSTLGGAFSSLGDQFLNCVSFFFHFIKCRSNISEIISDVTGKDSREDFTTTI